MADLHIVNTTFEWELTQLSVPSLQQSLEMNDIYLQLQFLPFLYAAEEDGVLVTHEPPQEFWTSLKNLGIHPPKLHLISHPGKLPYEKLKSWGAARSVAAWAQKHSIPYDIPPWEVICKVNSKEFSFIQSPKLPNATLVYSAEEAKAWLANQKATVVFKSCYGVSGKGHLFIDPVHAYNPERIEQFFRQEWKAGRPVLAEPWVSRVLDFSTQWEISKKGKIEYLGATVCENDAKGRYRHNRVGNAVAFFGINFGYLEEHQEIARTVLKKMAALGYYGNLGIDAMIYQEHSIPNKILLHPIVEINARKTMGWVALKTHQRHFPDRILSLNYTNADETQNSYLPRTLVKTDGSIVAFPKQLSLEVL